MAVTLLHPARQVLVNSSQIFLVGPACQPGPRASLFTLGIKLHTPKGPVKVTALVDTGCELPGLIHPRLVSALDLSLEPAGRTVRTATGEVVTGLQQTSVQTQFAPNFTRRVSYGVLEFPGFDVVLGEGFLRQCAPYQLKCDGAGHRSISLTSPSTHRMVESIAELFPELTVPPHPALLPASAAEPPAAASADIDMSWAIPSPEDYDNTVAAFSILLDPQSQSPVLHWSPAKELPVHSEWAHNCHDKLLTSQLEEGLVFRLGV